MVDALFAEPPTPEEPSEPSDTGTSYDESDDSSLGELRDAITE